MTWMLGSHDNFFCCLCWFSTTYFFLHSSNLFIFWLNFLTLTYDSLCVTHWDPSMSLAAINKYDTSVFYNCWRNLIGFFSSWFSCFNYLISHCREHYDCYRVMFIILNNSIFVVLFTCLSLNEVATSCAEWSISPVNCDIPCFHFQSSNVGPNDNWFCRDLVLILVLQS